MRLEYFVVVNDWEAHLAGVRNDNNNHIEWPVDGNIVITGSFSKSLATSFCFLVQVEIYGSVRKPVQNLSSRYCSVQATTKKWQYNVIFANHIIWAMLLKFAIFLESAKAAIFDLIKTRKTIYITALSILPYYFVNT